MRDISHQCQGREGERSRCHVLLPHVVCLQEGATWLHVCVLLRAMELDGGDRASFTPNDYWVCLTRQQPAESTWLARSPALLPHTEGEPNVRCAWPELNNHESKKKKKGHVIASLIVMFKSPQTGPVENSKRRRSHAQATRPFCLLMRAWKKGYSLCLYNFIALYVGGWKKGKTTFGCRVGQWCLDKFAPSIFLCTLNFYNILPGEEYAFKSVIQHVGLTGNLIHILKNAASSCICFRFMTIAWVVCFLGFFFKEVYSSKR